MPRIFISYARKYQAFAQKLSNSLRSKGYDTWFDVDTISPGEKWSTAIQNGLINCDYLIVIITPESMGSNNVEDEWQYFLDNKKPVFPILLKSAPIHFQLSRIQYIDFERLNYDTAFAKLLTILSKQITETPEEAITPSEKKPLFQTPPETAHLFTTPIEWCKIPAGNIILSDTRHMFPPGTSGGRTNVSEFYISRYPITQSQYEVFVSAKDGYTNHEWWKHDTTQATTFRDESTAKFGNDIMPVVCVNWFEASAFCEWLSFHVDFKCQLPTEVQWQRAAQGDPKYQYPWGDTFSADNCANDGTELSSIGAYASDKSPFDVIDMAGNIKEWCIDVWSHSPKSDGYRSVRGGAWFEYIPAAFSTTRRSRNLANLRSSALGFRVICTLNAI